MKRRRTHGRANPRGLSERALQAGFLAALGISGCNDFYITAGLESQASGGAGAGGSQTGGEVSASGASPFAGGGATGSSDDAGRAGAGTSGDAAGGGQTGDAGMAGAADGGAQSGSSAGGDGGQAGGGPTGERLSSPLELEGLFIWLDASLGIESSEGAVSSWRDQSPAAHLAAQGNPSLRPRLEANAFGRLPGIRFDGLDDEMSIPDRSSLRVGIDDFVVDVVLAHTTALTCCGGLVLAKQSFVYPHVGIGLFVNVTERPTSELWAQLDAQSAFLFTPVSDGIEYADGKTIVLGMTRIDRELTLRVNGQPVDSTLVPPLFDGGADGYDLFIGGNDQQLEGVLAEIVVARNVSQPEVTRLENYLLSKYAAALAR